MEASTVPSLGWTRRSAAVSVLLAMDEQRKQAGLRLVQLREARGWNQEDLAHEAGVSVKTVSRFENGRHDGRRRTITAIAEALGVDENDLVGAPPSPLAIGQETQLDRMEARLDEMNERILELRELLSAQGEGAAGPEMPAELAPPSPTPPPTAEPREPRQNGQAPADEPDAG